MLPLAALLVSADSRCDSNPNLARGWFLSDKEEAEAEDEDEGMNSDFLDADVTVYVSSGDHDPTTSSMRVVGGNHHSGGLVGGLAIGGSLLVQVRSITS